MNQSSKPMPLDQKLRSPFPHDQSQESEWVSASQRGDTLAFNRLVLKWERNIYNLSLRMLHDPDEAADMTQEVFLAAYRNVRRFRRDARFSTWLYRIAVNRCLSRLRRRPQGTHVSIDERDRGGPAANHLPIRESHEREFLLDEQRLHVRNALQHLQPDQRMVVELKFYQDLTFEEISAVTDTPVSTVKSRLYTGLEMLKVRLGTIGFDLA